ncbi:unnamed protein product [Ilex paraguariensis]|uniref:Uncharacterized protein n=1 Tax=Ilex paraguariensis TaxID=185542 RepID=A0ABC8TC91_9AQUA
MNNLSSSALAKDHRHCCSCKPIPTLAIYILVPLFFIGFGVSLLILIVVHNAIFFVALLFLSALLAVFLLWNSLNWRRNATLLLHLHSFPDSDLRLAPHGQLVKLTGLVSCGSVSLESSYEKVTRCVYTSTLLYESGGLGLKPADATGSCFLWRLAYSERLTTDFYITDRKSGIRALVKAGPDCKVIPLIVESRLVKTTGKCRVLSPHLTKWLKDRNLSAEADLLRLEEGYVKEGTSLSVLGMLQKNNDIVMIVQPQRIISAGCLWRKLLLPVDVDGLILWIPRMADPLTHLNSMECVQQ